MGTAMASAFALWPLGNCMRNRKEGSSSDYYHGVALAVLGVAALLLNILGWEILVIMGKSTSNKLVAIVSSLIPFAWATGLISRFNPKYEKAYLALMLLGLILIIASRFMDAPLMARIVYPVFHSTAGIVVIVTPILAFLFGGKQLLFFFPDFVLRILAPLLFITILLYSWGLLRGEES